MVVTGCASSGRGDNGPVSPDGPASTYRLQLNGEFTLRDAADAVPYLAKLGIGALYLSPILQAAEGSGHGYDVVDHSRVDRARGGQLGFEQLRQAALEAHLGIVLDIVPNHMSVDPPQENGWWWALLRDGPDGEAARWFDVDFAARNGKVSIPALSDKVAVSELGVEGDVLVYGERKYPLAAPVRMDEPLRTLLQAQHYELLPDRAADSELNFRRFFAVSKLAGIRVEDESVFDASHRLVLELARMPGVVGLRVDHPDGLTDPDRYLERLRAAAPSQWIVVEKILGQGEVFPHRWPVAGTTGYDALREVNGVMIDPSAEAVVDRCYREVTGDDRSWTDHVEAGKRHVATTILSSEVRRLARLVPEERCAADALVEVAVAFPHYRSYLPAGRSDLDDALAAAEARRPQLADAVRHLASRLHDPADELAVRFQQLTVAVTAKGVEDTAFYRYSRCIALNEVGSDPGVFGLALDDFHVAMARRQHRHPDGMTTLSTHDTKRGEDVRARLAVLAELPLEFAELAVSLLDRAPVPNRSFGYLLCQTAVAVMPIGRNRLHAYAEKAMREASIDTSWRRPDLGYERRVHEAVDQLYDDEAVVSAVRRFTRRISAAGWSNACSQKLVQLTMPGVPDCYQGTELLGASLVDPDNRTPVDFALRERMLEDLAHAPRPPRGGRRLKLWLTHRCLIARRDHSDLFTSYRPLPTGGEAAAHLIAFDRGGALTLATRLPVALAERGGWGASWVDLPDEPLREVLSGTVHRGRTAVDVLLGGQPCALLVPEAAWVA